MTDLYLILHKVRGEPAFDVACILSEEGTPTDPGPWWVIPTSGHRAYPYWTFILIVCEQAGGKGLFSRDHRLASLPEMPDDLPDHYEYQFNTDRISGSIHADLASIAEALLPKRESIKRRF